VCLTDHAELIMQMKILRQLEKSELFYKVIGRPLFGYGQNLNSEDVFYRKVERLFSPLFKCDAEEYDALMECRDAAFHILLRQEDGTIKSLPENTHFRHGFSIDRTMKFSSIEDAYGHIEKHSPCIARLDHFLKYRIFQDISNLAFEVEKDAFIADEFSRHIGGALGLSSNEIRMFIKGYAPCYEMKKAG